LGIYITWISVHGLSQADILDRLGLIETDRMIELAQVIYDKRNYGAILELPAGRVVYMTQATPRPEQVTRLSVGAELVACSLDEVTMYSEANGYQNGSLVWSVRRDDEAELDSFMVEGDPPGFVSALAEAKRRTESDERTTVDHYFEVPMMVAAEAGGFRGDQDFGDLQRLGSVVEPPDAATQRAQFAARAERRANYSIRAGLVGFLAWFVTQLAALMLAGTGRGWIAPFGLSIPLIVLYPLVSARAFGRTARSGRSEVLALGIAVLLNLLLFLDHSGNGSVYLQMAWRSHPEVVVVWFSLWMAWQALAIFRLARVRRTRAT
jgi:hypothetical protein